MLKKLKRTPANTLAVQAERMLAQTFTYEYMRKLKTAQLCMIYHESQLNCVATIANGALTENFYAACELMRIVVDARRIVIERSKAVGRDDENHYQFLAECASEYANLRFYYGAWLKYVRACSERALYGLPPPPMIAPFRFRSSRLIGNAIDAGTKVPKLNCPVGWDYKTHYIEVYQPWRADRVVEN